MDVALSLLITIVLTLVNGFFSMSEMALSTAKKIVLDHEAEAGDNRARTAADLIAEPSAFLAAIQVAITLVGFASSAFAATNLSDPLGQVMVTVGVPADVANGVAVVVITLLLSYFSIVVGELVPKRIAMSDAESVSKVVAAPLTFFSKLAKPLVWLTSASANGLATLLNIKGTEDRQDVSEDEIKYMVTDSLELSDEEKSMIHDVLDLGDTIAREVMVPRVDMTALPDTSTLSEVMDVMRSTGFSRVPIYHEDVDRIVGIAHIKDLIAPILEKDGKTAPVGDYVRTASFVPETKDMFPLLSEMQTSHDQMVIVVDEYGGTAGIVTLEDIVEEVVGEIEDEFDPDRKHIVRVSEGEWLVDGRYSIDDARELGWPVEETEEYETIAGFLLEIADKLPKPGDVYNVDGWEFRVQAMRGRRLSTLRVTAPRPENAGGEKDADEKAKPRTPIQSLLSKDRERDKEGRAPSDSAE